MRTGGNETVQADAPSRIGSGHDFAGRIGWKMPADAT
jgi:hypothetical protein